MVGISGIRGTTSRFVAEDSFSIRKIHRVGLETFVNPVLSSLKHNCTVLAIELQTFQCVIILLVIPDLDLFDLSLWLAALKAGPVVVCSLTATVGSVRESEFELTTEASVQFKDSDEVVVVAELVNSWKVSVLFLLEWVGGF